jgi:hypothetical protein
MWLALQGSILTKDNLNHRGWTGDERCRFCSNKESIDHLFFQCGVARFVWNVVSTALNFPVVPSRMDEVCDWLLKFKDLKFRQISAIGVIIVIWGIWKIRNKALFSEYTPSRS